MLGVGLRRQGEGYFCTRVYVRVYFRVQAHVYTHVYRAGVSFLDLDRAPIFVQTPELGSFCARGNPGNDSNEPTGGCLTLVSCLSRHTNTHVSLAFRIGPYPHKL